MFFYFGYGSNMSVSSLRAKGVTAMRSEAAMLEGWRLTFNIPEFFRIEGGTGNIELCPNASVHGVLHACRDADLATLDQLEAVGSVYNRIEASVLTYTGRRAHAYVYVGIPAITNPHCLPSQRYLNILTSGAEQMRLDPDYIAQLRGTPALPRPAFPPFVHPVGAAIFRLEDLPQRPHCTALAGGVFDMGGARRQHDYLKRLLSGKDVTLLFLKRMDTSSGNETFEDVRQGHYSDAQREYLNAYLHEFAREYRYLGRLDYDALPPDPSAYVLGNTVTASRAAVRPSTNWRLSPIWAARPPLQTQTPARKVLDEASLRHRELKNENLGFLSEGCGFMPVDLPRLSLPPAFAAWDQAAALLPELHRTLRLRRVLDDLPLLPADAEHLDEGSLLRAGSLLAMLSHAYQYVEPRPPDRLPEALLQPWKTVRDRLGRGPAVLNYIDLIVYNWRLLNPQRPDPMRIDNMRLAIPTVDNNEERVFYLTQAEILAHASPIVGAVVRAQEAVITDDPEALESELTTIIDCLKRIVRESLLNINPNPGSPYYVDPVIWAKTVAPFAVPFERNVQGPSGTTSPLFNTLDIFFRRQGYESFLGREIYNLRDTYPPLWRQYLQAVGEISVPGYVQQRGNANLKGLLLDAFATYAGEHGFLGRHRMKVYGYLQLAFKVGRSVTIGGFRGVFRDRTWDQVDSELEIARVERMQSFPERAYHVHIKSVDTHQPGSPDGVSHVVLDTSSCGIRHEAGDRCGILPENSDELINRTLQVLGCDGDSLIILNSEWRSAVRLRPGYENATALSLRQLLRFGRIRPVTPRMAEALHAQTQNETLKEQMLRQTTEQWELWDLLLLLRQFGYDPRALCGTAESSISGITSSPICRVVPPETFRMYSISSVTNLATTTAAQEMHLTVGRLRYETAGTLHEKTEKRAGTASNFLATAHGRKEALALVVQHPPRFSLPNNPRTPIVLLAGGTGVSPFRAFLVERLRHINAAVSWLFLGLRSREYFCYEEEFSPYLQLGKLELRVAFSRDDVSLSYVEDERGGRFEYAPGARCYVTDLLLDEATAKTIWQLVQPTEEGGQGAYVYVCGRSSFARSVIDALKELFARFASTDPSKRHEAAEDMLCRLVAEGRFLQEVFTGESTSTETLPTFPVSEIVLHNNSERGPWMVLDGKVYDLTPYLRLHPGGTRILQACAGIDASDAYARVHQGHSEVDAIRDMYCIGAVRVPQLGRSSAKIAGPSGVQVVSIAAVYRSWVQTLYLLVEMENALANDVSLQSASTTRDEPILPRSPYRLARLIETHQRFLRTYAEGLVEETLPNLWLITQGFFGGAQPASWMRTRLDGLPARTSFRFANAMVAELFRVVEELRGDASAGAQRIWERIRAACDIQVAADAALLTRLKETLRQGVMAFEQLGPRVSSEGGDALLSACTTLLRSLEGYFDGMQQQLVQEGQWAPKPIESESNEYLALRTEMKTLLLNNYWVMEEDQAKKIVILKRTALVFTSTEDVVRANDGVISQIRPAHNQYGIVVDMRQAPLRNDPAFENAMGRLRNELTSRYARLALLLETAVGVLQVNRIGREEGNRTFATRSESAAIKFAMGQG